MDYNIPSTILENPFLTSNFFCRVPAQTNTWDWHNSIPPFIGSFLGFISAVFLDSIKNRKERHKENNKEMESQLSTIGGMLTKLVFNVEILAHVSSQQILPHYHSSENNLDIINNKSISKKEAITNILSTRCEMFCRSPIPHFADISAFGTMQFLTNKNAELLKKFGWIESFMKDLIFIIEERNREIAKLSAPPTCDASKIDREFADLRCEIEVQNAISIVEIGNSYQFLNELLETIEILKKIMKDDYAGIKGPKLDISLPDILGELTTAMKDILQAKKAELFTS